MRVVRRLLNRYLNEDPPDRPAAAFARRRALGMLVTLVLLWDRAKDLIEARRRAGRSRATG
jgi:hypothetical protein